MSSKHCYTKCRHRVAKLFQKCSRDDLIERLRGSLKDLSDTEILNKIGWKKNPKNLMLLKKLQKISADKDLNQNKNIDSDVEENIRNEKVEKKLKELGDHLEEFENIANTCAEESSSYVKLRVNLPIDEIPSTSNIRHKKRNLTVFLEEKQYKKKKIVLMKITDLL
ncbi:hypothetical protein Avbf_14403 [Armadillidium vulgare]|nr:hypothetical protein Avbf_14403 [Armadillidium vulgare]